jgi:hypothetical protein
MTGGHDVTPQTLGTATTSRGGLGDRGAVAVEFALVLPVVLLLLVGIFDLGVAMIEKMELTYVVQGAAQMEAANANHGAPWAQSQLPSPASFAATNPAPLCDPSDSSVQYAQITGRWPVSLTVFSTLTLQAQACWPITPPPPTTSPIRTP